MATRKDSEAYGTQCLLGAIALVSLTIVHVPSWTSYYRGDPGFSRDKTDWKGAARYIEAAWVPGELIIAADLNDQICLGRYIPAILPSSYEDTLALLQSSGRGYVVDGGWRNPSDLTTNRHEFGSREEVRLALELKHLWLYEWGEPRPAAPASIEIEPGRRNREMFLGDGWSRSTYETSEGSFGIVEDGFAEVSFILRPAEAPGPFRLSIKVKQLSPSRSDLALTINGSPLLRRALDGTTATIEAELPSELLRTGSNLLGIRHEAPNPSRNSHPLTARTEPPWPIDVAVHSVGDPRGNLAWFFVGGRRYSWAEARRRFERGYTIMVLDETGGIDAWDSFDTCCSSAGEAESTRLAEFIDRIPFGRVVLATTREDASSNLTEEAVAALRQIGAEGNLIGRFRWMHSVVGVKGLQPGNAAEAMSPDETRIVIGTDPEAGVLLVERIRVTGLGGATASRRAKIGNDDQ